MSVLIVVDNMSTDNHNLKEIPEKFKEYIFYSFGSFAVKNDKNRIVITFGRFNSEDVACAATNLLIKHDWDIVSAKNDLISSYRDNYYVFKVINNNLIFDLKFNSFEEAVEYLEINYKCNDYNNDVLSKKKRKSRWKKDQVSLSVADEKIPNIYSKKDGFVVKYRAHGKEYGTFNSLEEACAAKKILVENNWKFSSSVEMVFYDSFYWVFKIEDNVLSFLNKFESYEDALDCLDSSKTNTTSHKKNQKVFGGFIREIDDDYIENIKKDDYIIESNFKKSIPIGTVRINRPRLNPIKRNRKSISPKIMEIDDSLMKKIAYESIKIKEMENIDFDNVSIDLSNLKSKISIVEFQNNTLKDYYTIFYSNGKLEFSENIAQFVEFKYIWKILNFYNWDLDKLKVLSVIHYFNNYYYILKVFNNKLVISGRFDSYSEAEDNIIFLNNYYSYSDNYQLHDIEKRGNYYSLAEKHGDKLFEIDLLKSFEELKAILDIFDYHNWDVEVFKKYDIFYYHGLYWEINYFFYYIKLEGRFNSKDDALAHKCNN